MYDWMISFAMVMSLYVDVMVMSSVTFISFNGACGVGSVRCAYVGV